MLARHTQGSFKAGQEPIHHVKHALRGTPPALIFLYASSPVDTPPQPTMGILPPTHKGSQPCTPYGQPQMITKGNLGLFASAENAHETKQEHAGLGVQPQHAVLGVTQLRLPFSYVSVGPALVCAQHLYA